MILPPFRDTRRTLDVFPLTLAGFVIGSRRFFIAVLDGDFMADNYCNGFIPCHPWRGKSLAFAIGC